MGHAPSFEVGSSNSIQKASGTEPCSQIFYASLTHLSRQCITRVALKDSSFASSSRQQGRRCTASRQLWLPSHMRTSRRGRWQPRCMVLGIQTLACHGLPFTKIHKPSLHLLFHGRVHRLPLLSIDSDISVHPSHTTPASSFRASSPSVFCDE